MTKQPRLRVKTKHNEHTYMMTITPEEFNHDYTLTVPSTPFRKDFVDNELWGQMKIYNDTWNTTISCTALCLDAEYNVLAEYLQNTEYDGVVPFECDLGNNKAFTLSDEKFTRIHFLSPSKIPYGNYIRAVLLNGGDYPLPYQKIHYNVRGKTNYTGDIETDNKGICTLPMLLDNGVYTVTLTYNGGVDEDIEYHQCSETKIIDLDGLHDTSLKVLETYYTTQDVFHMVKEGSGTDFTYKKALNYRRLLYVTGSDLFVRLTDREEQSVISDETVTIQVDGRTYSAKTNSQGIAVFQIYLNDNDYRMSVSYKGSNYYNSSQSTVNYRLCVRKSKATTIVCNNKDVTRGGNLWQLVSKGGNLRFQLKENHNRSFSGDNFYEVIDPNTGETYFYKDSACTQLWIKGDDDTEFLEATLRTQISKQTHTTISNETNHTRELTYAGSYQRQGTYIKEGTQKVKALYGITIGIPPNTDDYYVKVQFKGDNYFNSDEKIFNITYGHKGTSTTDRSSTSMDVPSTKKVIDSKHLTFRLRSEYNEYVKGKMISFNIKNKIYTSKIDNKGYVSLPVSLDVGYYSITAKFNGDNNFKASSKKFSFYVIDEKSNAVIDEPIHYLANYNSHLTIPEEINKYTEYVQFLYTISIRADATEGTPNIHVYFNNFMLNAGDYPIDYIKSNEEQDIVNYIKTYYALLYSNYEEDKGAEIIRPNKANFSTKRLTQNEHTIISPFCHPTIREDRAINICKEYLNFHNQSINISQDNQ